MNPEELLSRVARALPDADVGLELDLDLGDDRHVVALSVAVLDSLAERLSLDEVQPLAAELPEELSLRLLASAGRGEPPSAAGEEDSGAGPSAPAAEPNGWCMRATSSSTATAAAMGEAPGRVTVHCWSRLRSAVLSVGDTTSEQK